MINYFQVLNESLNAEPYQTELEPSPPPLYTVYYFNEGAKTYRIQFIKKMVIGKSVWVMFVNERGASLKVFKKILTKFQNPQRAIATIIQVTKEFLDSNPVKGLVLTLPTTFFGNYISLFNRIIQRVFKTRLAIHDFGDTVTPPKVAEQDYDNVVYIYTTVKPYKFESVYDGKWFVDAMAMAGKNISDVKELGSNNPTANVAKPEDSEKVSAAADKKVSPYKDKSQTDNLLSDIKQAIKNNEAAKHTTTIKNGKVFIDHPEKVWAVQTVDSIIYPMPTESDFKVEGYHFDQNTGGLSSISYHWYISQIKGVIKPTGMKATNPSIQSMVVKQAATDKPQDNVETAKAKDLQKNIDSVIELNAKLASSGYVDNKTSKILDTSKFWYVKIATDFGAVFAYPLSVSILPDGKMKLLATTTPYTTSNKTSVTYDINPETDVVIQGIIENKKSNPATASEDEIKAIIEANRVLINKLSGADVPSNRFNTIASTDGLLKSIPLKFVPMTENGEGDEGGAGFEYYALKSFDSVINVGDLKMKSKRETISFDLIDGMGGVYILNAVVPEVKNTVATDTKSNATEVKSAVGSKPSSVYKGTPFANKPRTKENALIWLNKMKATPNFHNVQSKLIDEEIAKQSKLFQEPLSLFGGLVTLKFDGSDSLPKLFNTVGVSNIDFFKEITAGMEFRSAKVYGALSNRYKLETNKEDVVAYTGSGYGIVNNALRGVPDQSDVAWKRIKNIDKAFGSDGVRIPDTVVVYRGQSLTTDEFKAVTSKAPYIMRAYTSTSLSIGTALGFMKVTFGAAMLTGNSVEDDKKRVLLCIEGLSSTLSLIPGKQGNHYGEHEIILNRGTVLVQTSKEFVKGKLYIIPMKVVDLVDQTLYESEFNPSGKDFNAPKQSEVDSQLNMAKLYADISEAADKLGIDLGDKPEPYDGSERYTD